LQFSAVKILNKYSILLFYLGEYSLRNVKILNKYGIFTGFLIGI